MMAVQKPYSCKRGTPIELYF